MQHNRTNIYLFPLLGIDKKDLHPFVNQIGNSELVGSFLGIEGKPEYDNKLCILLKYDKERYSTLESLLSTTPGLIHSYEIDKKHTMYIFDILEEYKQSFEYILNGEYSKVFDEHKKIIIKFNSYPYKQVGEIIESFLYRKENGFKFTEKQYKIKIPRNQEADSKINLEKEKFNESLHITSN